MPRPHPRGKSLVTLDRFLMGGVWDWYWKRQKAEWEGAWKWDLLWVAVTWVAMHLLCCYALTMLLCTYYVAMHLLCCYAMCHLRPPQPGMDRLYWVYGFTIVFLETPSNQGKLNQVTFLGMLSCNLSVTSQPSKHFAPALRMFGLRSKMSLL